MTVSLSELDARLRKTAIGRNILRFEAGDSADEVDSSFRPTSSETRANSFYTWSNLQKELFLNRGISRFQLASIHEKEDSVIKQALAMDLDKDGIPFVWVPSSHLISIPTLMSMIIGHDRIVTFAGPMGFTRLDPRKLLDCTDTLTPDSHSLWYVIFNVENDFTAEHNRSFLTVREAIAVCICTSILKEKSIAAVGSTYGQGRSRTVPILGLSKNGPELSHTDDWSLEKQPSCRGRL